MEIKKKLLFLLLMLTCGLGAAWAQQQQQHVTIAPTQNGSVTVDNYAPYSGETVTITVSPDPGYVLNNLQATCENEGNVVTLNLTELGNGRYTFTMPELDVTISATFEHKLYQVEVEEPLEGEHGFVMVDNIGHSDNKFYMGETVSLLVSTDTGYALKVLEATYEEGTTEVKLPLTPAENDNYTFVMPAADVHVHWIVDKAQYTISITESAHGKVVADKTTAQFGEEVTLTATPDDNYLLESLNVAYTNGFPVTVTNNKFTMPAANVVVSATFKAKTYNIAVAPTEHGTVTAPASAEYDSPVEFSVTPDPGYVLGSIKVIYTQGSDKTEIPVSQTQSGSYTFTMPGTDVTIVAAFEPATYSITVAPTEHGTVTAPASARFGETVSGVVATPDKGYEIDEIYYTYDVGGSVPDPKFDIENGTFTMPGTDVTIVATFKLITYAITVAPTEHGTITAPASAEYDSPVEFTVTPDPGYVLGSIKVIYTQGSDKTEIPVSQTQSGSYTFTMPGTDVTIVAAFEPATYSITVAPTEHGTVTAPASARFGETVSGVVATPDKGYEIDEIYYTYDVGGSVPDPKFDIENGTFTMPGTDVTIVATFKLITYAITVAPTEHGTVSVPGNAAPDTQVEFAVTPEPGYRLSSIKVIYTQGPDETEIPMSQTESGSYTFTMPDADVTVVAAFERYAYVITVAPTEHGTVSVPDVAAPDAQVEFTVTPDAGYRLSSIKVIYAQGPDETEIAMSQTGSGTYTFTMPDADVTIVAAFEEEVATGINDVNASTGAHVRYFDLQGRYIGTTLSGARPGVYVTSDGRKVVK